MRVINIRGHRCYHKQNCYWISDDWVKNKQDRRAFPSISAVRRTIAGAHPCGHCKPPLTD